MCASALVCSSTSFRASVACRKSASLSSTCFASMRTALRAALAPGMLCDEGEGEGEGDACADEGGRGGAACCWCCCCRRQSVSVWVCSTSCRLSTARVSPLSASRCSSAALSLKRGSGPEEEEEGEESCSMAVRMDCITPRKLCVCVCVCVSRSRHHNRDNEFSK